MAIKEAESRRAAAALAYGQDKTVASEMLSIQTEMEVANAWSAYLRATRNHTHSLKWADQAAKFASRISALRELTAVDLLQELAERDRQEQHLLGRVRGQP